MRKGKRETLFVHILLKLKLYLLHQTVKSVQTEVGSSTVQIDIYSPIHTYITLVLKRLQSQSPMVCRVCPDWLTVLRQVG